MALSFRQASSSLPFPSRLYVHYDLYIYFPQLFLPNTIMNICTYEDVFICYLHYMIQYLFCQYFLKISFKKTNQKGQPFRIALVIAIYIFTILSQAH